MKLEKKNSVGFFPEIKLSTREILSAIAAMGIMANISIANAEDKIVRDQARTAITLDIKEPISIERIMSFLGEYFCTAAEQKGDTAGADKCRKNMSEIIAKCNNTPLNADGTKTCKTVTAIINFIPFKLNQ